MECNKLPIALRLLAEQNYSHSEDLGECAGATRNPVLKDVLENLALVHAALAHALAAAADSGRAAALEELTAVVTGWLCDQRVTVRGEPTTLGKLAIGLSDN